MFNIYNTKDQALRIDRVSPWWSSQIGQKPLGGEGLSWALLKNTSIHQDKGALWTSSTDTSQAQAKFTRRWAELAYWFQPLSEAAGTQRMEILGNDQNFSADEFAGDGAAFDFTSHSFMTVFPLSKVKKGYEWLGQRFK